MTEKYKKYYKTTIGLSMVVTVLPIIVFLIVGLCSGSIGTVKKFTICFSAFCAGLVFVFGLVAKINLKSPIWIFLLSCFGLDNFWIILICFASSTFIDEIILKPLSKKYKNLYIINKEIDKRL